MRCQTPNAAGSALRNASAALAGSYTPPPRTTNSPQPHHMPTTNTTTAAPGDLPDSGRREEFNTGSRRDTREGKGRYDLLPTRALRRLAIHFERGSRKYGDRNWEKGQPLSRYLDSGLRHAFSFLEGQRNEDHLAAAAWNFLCLCETQERIADGILPAILDDLPGVRREEEAPYLYLAGPMRGIPEYNFPAFAEAAAQLRAAGYEVWSPAEADIARDGFDPRRDPVMPIRYYMRRDLPAVMLSAGVALLPGWENSKGAKLEKTVAEECGLPCRPVDEWIDRKLNPNKYPT